MKKIISLLFSVILTMNCVNAHITSDMCNFRFVLSDKFGFGWYPLDGIEIKVDGVDYGFLNLAWGSSYAEEIVPLPSGEVQLYWIGSYDYLQYHFEVYNSSDELIYTSPNDDFIYGLFFTYRNECPHYVECLPIIDLDGVYISETDRVNLTWKAPESDDLTGFDIYRNDSLIAHLPPTAISYSDNTEELENGNYTYCVIPVYPVECDLEDECIVINIKVGIKNYIDFIMIYPNPASNVINIFGVEIANVKVFNTLGQLILTQDNKNEINVSKLTDGIFILSIETLTGSIIQKKIIIQK